ncbi:hypothetical protein D9615_009332 [Tricholomella constricta]|uniref:Uncharacterized protein n=1 Tax=Tricholomella constricta TaxID=117010 RepID=A0A8H5H2R1_9AGAR|nr:hypothetical protein D9615_009332 [Tricholomella constricta]
MDFLAELQRRNISLRDEIRENHRLSAELRRTRDELERARAERASFLNQLDAAIEQRNELWNELAGVEVENYRLKDENHTLSEDAARAWRSYDDLHGDYISVSFLFSFNGTHGQCLQLLYHAKDRRDLHYIRRRILAEKTITALKSQYGQRYPMLGGESFSAWLERIGYPDWQKIIGELISAKADGNGVAHNASYGEMAATVAFAYEDGCLAEPQILQVMFDIVYGEFIENS